MQGKRWPPHAAAEQREEEEEDEAFPTEVSSRMGHRVLSRPTPGRRDDQQALCSRECKGPVEKAGDWNVDCVHISSARGVCSANVQQPLTIIGVLKGASKKTFVALSDGLLQ